MFLIRIQHASDIQRSVVLIYREESRARDVFEELTGAWEPGGEGWFRASDDAGRSVMIATRAVEAIVLVDPVLERMAQTEFDAMLEATKRAQPAMATRPIRHAAGMNGGMA